jgi:4-amino-4-deoxy-L-arabinose transferase-like glycosyltransferase
MTVTEIRPGVLDDVVDGDPTRPRRRRGLRRVPLRNGWAALVAFVIAHRAALLIGTSILVVCGLVHGIGFDGYPGRINDDEGTYVAQAYAIDFHHSIAPYTYTYDHPFGGWLLMAGVFWITGALHWATTAVTAGRLFMLGVHLVSCLFIYGLARRLDFRRVTALATVALFSLSPLAIFYQRLAFLDNIAVMWLLASMYCAASPKRRISTGLAAGAMLAAAIWSKETVALMLPTVYWILRQHCEPFNRRMVMRAFWGVLIGGVGIYALYALTKGELFAGAGHVSLLSSLDWQLFQRPSSGSVLDTHSGAYGLVLLWIHTDPILLVGGAVACIPAFLVPRLRPLALAVAIQVVMVLRGGYLPFAYVTAVLPFAALVIAGGIDALWVVRSRVPDTIAELTEPTGPARSSESAPFGAVKVRRRMVGRRMVNVPIAAAAVFVVVLAALQWPSKIGHDMTTDDSLTSRQATQWFLANEPHNSVVLTDDDIWTDLRLADPTTKPVWLFKVDLDPTVTAELGGWQGIDYTILGPLTASDMQALPTVGAVLQHSVVVKTFGEYTIRKVVK